jgi:Undecaprenyl-phosphate glucose phosphotransferase
MTIQKQELKPDPPLRRRAIVNGDAFEAIAASLDLVTILCVSVLTGSSYHLLVYGDVGFVPNYVETAAACAIFYVALMALGGNYRINNYVSARPALGSILSKWNIAFLLLFFFTFLTKSIDEYSRAGMALFYLVGFPTLTVIHVGLARAAAAASRRGLVAVRRVLVVGREQDLSHFARRFQPADHGIAIIGFIPLSASPADCGTTERGQAVLAELETAIARTRALHPYSVFILARWSEVDLIESCIERFVNVPVEIHLIDNAVLGRFEHAKTARVGAWTTLQVTRAPLTTIQILKKRVFDIAVASLGLVVLAPLFAVVAILIRLEGAGPVFFLQKRYGFNQQPFQIIKFRTMTTLEDDDAVRQVTRGDQRVTRVGRWLRRWNIDELPQLVNVLRGDMSLVGPRPHALAHNREYEQKIARYARRHNVKPGITGWAQVNGLRGETDTVEKMIARVEHDLYYIDNWSFGFDILILSMTLFSPRSYRNAFLL